jgi:hypothetical protein
MALRIGCLLVALTFCACKGETKTQTSDLESRCDKLAKACGDTDKHVEKIADGCKQAAKDQSTCTDKVLALYDCYEKELCGKTDKVWALDDLRVLAERKTKCAAEREAARTCAGK